MGLTKSKGNMYTWVKPWNPLGGECSHKCRYCSSQSFMRYPQFAKKYSGPPKFIEHEFKNLGSGKTMFVVAQNDLFAENVPSEMIDRVLAHCMEFDNKYLFQTKNPGRMIKFECLFPLKTILCTTIETNRQYPQMGNAPCPFNRAMDMNKLAYDGFVTYVTIEPIMDFDLKEMVHLIKRCLPKQVNIGGDSKNNHLPEPSKEKILALIDELKKFTVIDQKRNLSRLLK